MEVNKEEYPHLKYVFPISSFIDTTFYQKLSELKLDELKLNEASISLSVTLDLSHIPRQSFSVPLLLNSQCFNRNKEDSNDMSERNDGFKVKVKGEVVNFNRIDQFKSLDKQEFLYEQGMKIWNECKKDINHCFKFLLVSFADLKKYKYTYWLLIPTFVKKGTSFVIQHKLDSIPYYDNVINWFSSPRHRNRWVCIMNQGVLKDYDPDNFQSSDTIFIRDTSTIEGVASSITKNILTTIKYNNPEAHELSVYFIRSKRNESFGYIIRSQGDDSKDFELKVTGLERNIEGKLAPRQIDLSSLVDPLKIAEQSIDLNLRLMKWRIAPDLNLDVIRDTKVLLLGAGTLGCYIARALMGWGVRTITFVDNGTVSYSNLVRQPLFEFTDCGKSKAEVAANALKRIFPLLDTKGVNISIPMIGHPITNESREGEEYEKLGQLIDNHDVIYLLMDSREARWLPTVLANVKGKIVINAALGFDSYLVMRHGIYKDNGVSEREDTRLGCYFCNDVVVPTDSLTSKTLDQMCTVTRPGVAMLASAQAVELMVSLLQNGPEEQDHKIECILGEIPHQIRGFLDKFETLKVESPAYMHCSACSRTIVETCREDGWQFVKAALNDNEYIERISGLLEVKQNMEDVMDDILWESGDDM